MATGTKLNQMRFLRRSGSQDRYWRPLLRDADLRKLDKTTPLVDGTVGQANIRNGLNVGVDLRGTGSKALIGYRALKFADVLDVEKRGHNKRDFWEPIYASKDDRLILQPNEFYILASRERIQVPPEYAAEMIPIDPMMGEFRVHYAGFFDPGFGHAAEGGARIQGGAGGAHAGGPVRPGARPDDRAPGLRGAGRSPRQDLRAGHCLPLPGPGAEAVQALPVGTGGRLRGRISASQEPGARRGPVRAGRRLCRIRGRLLG